MKEIHGDLISLAKDGEFDVITHGCNCFCTMGAGIAVPMKLNFGCDKFPMENIKYRGDINKLGTIDYEIDFILDTPVIGGFPLTVVNSYTQYKYGRNHSDGDKNPVDYEAITMCMRKINYIFPRKRIGLPQIGSGLAGGDWNRIKHIIIMELKDMDVTIVYYKP
jgi:O-acetyl-ADP-ribose deacetylase (regulator of RNase III)